MGTFRYIGLPAIKERALAGLKQGVTEACEHLAGAAQEAAPVDTGTLRASIHVESIDVTTGGVTGTVATGGEANEYAVYQHEGTSRGVPATKFLEGPLIDNRALYLETIRRSVRGEL